MFTHSLRSPRDVFDRGWCEKVHSCLHGPLRYPEDTSCFPCFFPQQTSQVLRITRTYSWYTHEIMLLNVFLLAATLSASACQGATPTATEGGWAAGLLEKKHEIVERLRDRVAGSRLQRRQSAPTCPFVRDDEGNCCSTPVLQADGDCCPSDRVYSPSCAPQACCEDGEVYIDPVFFASQACCRSPSVVFFDASGTQACCPSGIVAGVTCCDVDQIPDGNTCINRPDRERVKRTVSSSSGSYMVRANVDACSATVLLTACPCFPPYIDPTP
ncbi:hypothetical protein P389DRAFT_63955 [Cystobasidium minutum MCA 4210]|uniref:uncharacterized protein n=1 Tax=Cystobasidium minutum MCA 4210 TaxID=1397322 RepID=UPI0034CD9A84|eukprot:jgi/Rhomi1/63955/CE63954_95